MQVNDAFFNLIVYEMLTLSLKKHQALPEEKQSIPNLCLEVETMGV